MVTTFNRFNHQMKRPGVGLLILWALLLTACGHSRVNLQPEIQSAQPALSGRRSAQVEQKIKDAELNRELPAMNGIEHERLGDALLRRGDLHAAYLHYDKAHQLSPDNTELAYKKGLTLLKAANGGEAARQFQAILDQHPDHALSHEGMGRALLMQNRISQAKSHFMRAVQLNDQLWFSHNCLGTLHDREGQHQAAAAAYQRAIRLRPDNGAIYNNLGMSRLQAGEYKPALQAFQEAVRRGYAAEKAYNNIGLALAHLGYHGAAFDAFKKAGGEPRAYNNLGCFYMNSGQLEKAIACFEKAIAAEPTYYVTASENLRKAKAAAGNY